jgi:hypothetical protein
MNGYIRKLRGRKGQIMSVTDLFLTFLFAILLVVGIYLLFSLNILGGSNTAIKEMGDVRVSTAAINNIYVDLESGNNYEKVDLNKQIEESKILGGKVVTSCSDYKGEVECVKDTVGVYTSKSDKYCAWKDNKCNWEVLVDSGR